MKNALRVFVAVSLGLLWISCDVFEDHRIPITKTIVGKILSVRITTVGGTSSGDPIGGAVGGYVLGSAVGAPNMGAIAGAIAGADEVRVQGKIVACKFIVELPQGVAVEFEASGHAVEDFDFQERIDSCSLLRPGDKENVYMTNWYLPEVRERVDQTFSAHRLRGLQIPR